MLLNWFNRPIKKLVARKRRIYRAEGKSQKYKDASKEAETAIKAAKVVHFEIIEKKVKEAGNTRDFYKSVNLFKTKQTAVRWHIKALYPELSNEEIAGVAAEFFNRISKEYEPLPNPKRAVHNSQWTEYIHAYQVADRLKKFRKPKSTVAGDINPALINDNSDILALPLAFIFNQTLNTREWPELWKSETVHVIPKNSAPNGLGELRNLSCTPLVSKVLESFVLERLKNEVKLSRSQYGGVSGCSTSHFLIDTWNSILSGLEKGESAINLISVDFAKAFNRMDHVHCLEALTDLGASETSIDNVATFLYGRTMSVKIGNEFSNPKPVPGGSPQGSILGNFLFCATTDAFSKLRAEVPEIDTSGSSSEDTVSVGEQLNPPSTPSTAISTPTARGQFRQFLPPACLADLNGSYISDDEESFRFLRERPVNRISSSDSQDSEDEEINMTRNQALCSDPIQSFVYIDDYNSLERLKLTNAPSHITTHRRQISLRAPRTEILFEKVQQLISCRYRDES